MKPEILLLLIFFSLLSFNFANFNIKELEKESILFRSKILAKMYSGKKTQWQEPYGVPKPKLICQNSSVWLDFYGRSFITKPNETILQTLADPKLWNILTEIGIEGLHTNPMKLAGGITSGKFTGSVDGGYDRISLNIDPMFGTQEQYIQMTNVVHLHKGLVVGDLIPGHTGLGPDFILALMNYKDYPGIYTMVEIDEKDWSLLPEVHETEFSKNLNFDQVDQLTEKGYIVGRLQRVIFAEPKIKTTNWDVTKVIKGVDGKERRWVYLHYFKAGQPTLNWLDPSFAADRLTAADIMQSLGVLHDDGLRLDANGFLGVETKKNTNQAWSEGHPLSIVSTNLISMLIRKIGHFTRKFGGFTYQELNLTIPDMKTMLELGADFSYDFITRTAYCHALICEDADFLRLNIELMNQAKISPVRFIHALQNHDEITYELVEFQENSDTKFKYKNKEYSGKNIRKMIRDEDFSKILTKNTPYILPSGNGPCTTMVGLCSAALGIKDIFSMTKKQKEQVKKAHLLLTFFNAMQPGIFMISGWDLVGAYPLRLSQVKALTKDKDNRWINRGAYDLLNVNPTAKKSKCNIPKAMTLYGPLPDQLKDPNSFVSKLKNILKIRKEYRINLARPIEILPVKHPALYIAMYKLYDDSILIIALNFSKKSLKEKIQLPQIKFKRAKELISKNKEDKKYFSDMHILHLNGLEAKAIIFN